MTTTTNALLNRSPCWDHKSGPPKPFPKSIPKQGPPIAWQNTVRKLLRALPRTSLNDEQLKGLHITLQDDDELSVCPTPDTLAKIDSFFTTSTYRGNVKCLPRKFQSRPEMARSCSEWITSLFTCWGEELGEQFSETQVKFQRRANVLLITGDTYTKGIKSTMTVRDADSSCSISVITRNRRRHEWQLTSTELYALLTLADEQRKARPLMASYKVHVMTIHTYWIQRLCAIVPASYITSIIAGKPDIVGHIKITRTPWFNFMEESGRRGALRAMFEDFPLSTACTMPPLPPFPPPKRKATDENESVIKKQRKV